MEINGPGYLPRTEKHPLAAPDGRCRGEEPKNNCFLSRVEGEGVKEAENCESSAAEAVEGED